MTIIYLRTNKVNGMMYVGQTKNLKSREHSWKVINTLYGNKVLTEDKKKYGTDNFTFDVLTVCPNCIADFVESYYIKKLNTQFPNGYNFQSGGKKGFTCTESEETKAKKSKSHKGKIPPCAKTKLRRVYQYTLDGLLVNVWESTHEAARVLGFCRTPIRNCCQGGFYCKGKWKSCKTYKGYRWSYTKKSEDLNFALI